MNDKVLRVMIIEPSDEQKRRRALDRARSSKMFAPPQRAEFDEGNLGDTRYEWAVQRYNMERAKSMGYY